MEKLYKRIQSPVGELLLVASEQGLSGILWKRNLAASEVKSWRHDDQHPILRRAGKQLKEYFKGRRTEFDLPLTPEGTQFQQSVWKLLRTIPYGKTWSYGELARRLGDVKKARAVGMATGRNPISIMVPCHRLVGANGSLTGFGGGLKNKQRLLDIERSLR